MVVPASNTSASSPFSANNRIIVCVSLASAKLDKLEMSAPDKALMIKALLLSDFDEGKGIAKSKLLSIGFKLIEFNFNEVLR